jgi:hypothetical protein
MGTLVERCIFLSLIVRSRRIGTHFACVLCRVDLASWIVGYGSSLDKWARIAVHEMFSHGFVVRQPVSKQVEAVGTLYNILSSCVVESCSSKAGSWWVKQWPVTKSQTPSILKIQQFYCDGVGDGQRVLKFLSYRKDISLVIFKFPIPFYWSSIPLRSA